MPPKRRATIYVAAASLLLAAGMAYYGQEKTILDMDQWRSGWEQSSAQERYKLSKALIVHLNAHQPSRDDVLRLLGSPDREIGDSFLQYDLGRHSSVPLFSRDKWWLSISFEDGNVSEAKRNPD
ncbi:hypothetical protein [Brevifollis gellanilyticus]|uniref:Lipoprotein SmpA/OmlA domain-containing protein n=1 Tax=Brevifollis gellanilyticus TaxID=748831 RepID=A0A512M4H3_9BACT|nr:hypothetical protein [Brevifollis gellanilyticus]GEP41618.1 hypothetical protein BGE01nite_09090 [Brevifollis gellanilyticus]